MNELHLFVYGEIGATDLFSEGAPTVDDIQKQIQAHPEAKEIVVHINSPGGGVFDGWAIGNILKNSGKKTTAQIEGFCASIATFIALSCDTVEMAETAMFMIHNPSVGLQGDEKEMQKAAVQLSKIKDDLIRIYKAKTGISVSQLSKMMDEETTLTAQEAKAEGFVDNFMTPIKAVAKFDINKNIMPEAKENQEIKDGYQKILDKLDKFFKFDAFKDVAENMTVTLSDGGSIFVESEDGELEGKKAFTVDEEGNPTETPVEDGVHTLEDGRSITVEGGVVLSVQEAMPTEEVDVLKEQVKNLEAQIAEAQKEKEELAEANAKETGEIKTVVSELMAEVKNFKQMTVGNVEPVKKPVIQPENKFKSEPEPKTGMDNFANYLKQNR